MSQVTRADALKFNCPTCGANIDERCRNKHSGGRQRVHQARYVLAVGASKGAPVPVHNGRSKRIATIITDASFCSDTGAAGWAGRLTYDGQRYTYSGQVKQTLSTSSEAEIIALANTLHMIIYDNLLPHGLRLCIQIDNHRAREIVLDRARQLSDVERRARTAVNAYIRQVSAERYVKHVKAHTPQELRDRRHHVHELMDRLAKGHMRKKRDALRAAEDKEDA